EVAAFGRRRALREREARAPFTDRSDGSRHEAATAVRAHVEQLGVDARCAERAFVGADAGLGGRRRKIDVAVLAVRSELQRHAASLGADYVQLDPITEREVAQPPGFTWPDSGLTISDDTSTASKDEPLIEPSACKVSLFQRESGAPLMNQ